MQPDSPQDEATKFFKDFVVPGIEDWRKDQVDVRLAMNLANSLNNLVEYYWCVYATIHADRVFHTHSLKAFRTELSRRNNDIAMIRDIADAHKHLKLDRVDREITNAKKRTLTNLYNARPAWLDLAHKSLDQAVAAAYGWTDYTPDMPDEEILRRLLALNLERAAQA